MIIAGIDEAGLGPTLGPLATASFALHCPNTWSPSSPWNHLSPTITQHPQKNTPTLTICDSKLLYPAFGLTALEHTLTTLNTILHNTPSPQPTLTLPQIPRHPCYTQNPTPTPPTPETTAALNTALQKADAKPVHYETHLLHEPAFNHILHSGLNKNQLLLQQTGRHLQTLVARFAQNHPLLIVADKQGGRNSYTAFLAALFPETWPRELESGNACSRYIIRPHNHDVEIRFQAKADKTSFCTAAASIAAKYAREQAMTQLNAWFAERVPNLKPTAGYPQDAKRWLTDINTKFEELQVDLLVREK